MKRGHVPTARVAPIIGQLIAERWPEYRRGPEEPGGVEILAEKVGCHPDTLDGILRQQNEGADFDLVDNLLCALGRWDMWHGVLADVYPTQFMETCAIPSCQKRFPEYHRGGKHPKRYCSLRCSRLGVAMEAGLRPGTRNRQKGKCLRGHAMTGDNVIERTRPDGSLMRQCATCRRESDRAYKQRKREELACAA